MNQGIAFARTLRALDAYDFRASKFGLIVAAAILAAWTWWMFAALIPQYETTTNVRIASDHASAYFPPAALTRIHPGQSATLRFNTTAFPARVTNVFPDHADLVITSHQPPATTSTSATAEVEVSTTSPAAIALRAIR